MNPINSILAVVVLFFLSARLIGQIDPCALIPDSGPCFASITAYYWDVEMGSCAQFVWGGCEGTVPFWTLNDCLNAECEGNMPPVALCDSIAVDVITVGDAALGHLEVVVTPDYQTPYWYGYAGFALYDEFATLIAAESLTTAPNAFGFDGDTAPHSRYLEYEPAIDLSDLEAPFELELRLYEGWMSGNPIARCSWIWTSFNEAPNDVVPIPFTMENFPSETYDMLGRPAHRQPGQLLIERFSDGRVRKVILSE